MAQQKKIKIQKRRVGSKYAETRDKASRAESDAKIAENEAARKGK